MKNILIHMPLPVSASSYYRALLPYRHCHKNLEDEGIKLHMADQIRLGSHYDAVVVRREVDKAIILHLNQRRIKDGCVIAWDVDDDFWSVPDWSPVKYSREQIEEVDLIGVVCDEIWASTEPLAKKCGSKAKVLPNLADIDDWFGGTAQKTDDIRILWAGSSTHRRDIELCSEAIINVAKKKPEVKFHFYGYCPEPILAALWPNHIVYHEWTELRDYWKTMRDIKPTIALAPLVDCEFNRSKSNIRWLENTLAGAAVVASRCPAYIDSDPTIWNDTEWEDELISMIEDKSYTCEVRNDDMNTITKNWSWSAKDQKERWMRAFRDLVS